MIYSDNELKPNEKLALILDYFLQYPNEYIRPITILKNIGVKHNQKRAFYKYCKTLKDFAIIDSKNPYSGLTNEKDTEYILTQNKDVEFSIPNDSKKRLMYAQYIVVLLTGFKVGTVTDERVLPAIQTSLYSMIISIGSGLARETIIASKLYNYFKLSQGSLLTILTEIKKYKLSISIDTTVNDTKLLIENTKIKNISLNKNEKIILDFDDIKIALDDFSSIKNIKILSDSFPQSNTPLQKLTKKDIIQAISNHKKYNKMLEKYHNLVDVEYSESEEPITVSFDDFINKMLNEEVDDKSFLDRVRRYLIPKSSIKQANK